MSPQIFPSELVDPGLVGGPRQDGLDDFGIGDIEQRVALLGEPPDVVAQ